MYVPGKLLMSLHSYPTWHFSAAWYRPVQPHLSYAACMMQLLKKNSGWLPSPRNGFTVAKGSDNTFKGNTAWSVRHNSLFSLTHQNPRNLC
jgi:hypothetical protein